MHCDAIDDFEDIEIGTLSSIASSMKDSIASYFDLSKSELAEVSSILDLRFKNSSHEAKSDLKTFVERNGVIVQLFRTEPHEKA